MDIDGAVALVSGGNRGIGLGFVEELLAAGAAKVYVGSRDPANAEAVVATDPERLSVVRLDIADHDEVGTAAEQCADVTLLVNNAGVFNQQTLMGASDMDALTAEIAVNYLGTMAMCRAFAPVIEANGGGCILNVLSAGAIVAVPEMGGYSRRSSPCERPVTASEPSWHRGVFTWHR